MVTKEWPEELLRGWAPEPIDPRALARLHEAIATRPAPVVEPWREVGRTTVALAEQRELAVETRLSLHHNTVMDLAVAPSGHAASVDLPGPHAIR